MWQLVHFQFKRRWKYEVATIAMLILFAIVIEHINVIAITMPILLARATYASEQPHYSYKQLFTMPIQLSDLVKARFVYEAISYYLIIITLTILIVVQGDVGAFGFFTALIIVFNVLYGHAIFVEFSAVRKASYIDYIFGIFPTLGFIIVHFLIIMMDMPFSKWPLLLIMPLLSCFFLKYTYKKSVTQLPLKDLHI